MKTLILSFLTLLLLTVSCGGDGKMERALAQADSLADAREGAAAIRLLDSLRPEIDGCPLSVRNHYALLCIKAFDKARRRLTTDSVIKPLVEYYENDGDKSLLPTAYYYAGRTYRQLNDAPQALDYFQKSC